MRRVWAVVLLAVSAVALGSEDDAQREVSWYQIELLVFQQPSGAPASDERLDYEAHRWLPSNIAALDTGQPPHPRNIGQLAALRDYWGTKTRLERVTPGLDPETEALIDWARREAKPVDRFRLAGSLAADMAVEVPQPQDVPLPEVQPHSSVPPGSAQPSGGAELPSAEPAQSARPGGDATSAGSEPEDAPVAVPIDLALRTVERRELLLATEARRLARAGIDITYHGAWRMPMAPDDPPLSVLLEDDRELLGFLEVTRRRFLHAHLVVWAREPEGLVEMNARVRMRRDETHLLDHPLLGALIRIERYEYQPADQ